MDPTGLVQAITNGLLMGGLYALVAVGLTIIFGTMNVVNFAHGEFLMLGMYSTYLLNRYTKLDPLILLFVVVPIMFLVGALVEKTLIQRVVDVPQERQILLTLGISVLMANGVLLIFGPNYHAVTTPYRFNALNIGPIVIPLARLIAFAMAVLLAAVLGLFLAKTDLGRALRATAENPSWAVLMGIDSAKIFMLSFGIGVALAAAAGTLMTPFYNTYPMVGETFGMLAYVVVVLGGLGNAPGAVLGALVIGVTESLTAQFVALDLALFGVYLIFILVLLFRPTGIIGGGRIG